MKEVEEEEEEGKIPLLYICAPLADVPMDTQRWGRR
jgi:hypothetical protein